MRGVMCGAKSTRCGTRSMECGDSGIDLIEKKIARNYIILNFNFFAGDNPEVITKTVYFAKY